MKSALIKKYNGSYVEVMEVREFKGMCCKLL